MQIHQLRYLRAVVRSGSITRAAEAEHVSQPSISKQLRLLELELGTPLFHRVGRRVVPTSAGLALSDCAGRVLADIDETVAALAGPESMAGGQLRICATETLAGYLLPPALAALRSIYPRARVSVEMLGTDDALARLLGDDADFALVPLPLADSRLEVHSLLDEDVLLVMPLAHRLAALDHVPLVEALGDPGLLLSMPGHGLRMQVDRAAQELGVDLAGAFELRSQQALLAMVASGGGIAFAPRMAVEGRTDVVARAVTPAMRRQVGWVRRKGRHLPPLGPALLALLGQAGSIVEVSPKLSMRSR